MLNNKYFLMRHAESDHNVGSVISCKLEDNSEITHIGRKQAIKLGEKLKKKDIHVIYCSPFKRVIATVLRLGLDAPFCSDIRLRQYDCGVFNGKTWEEREAYYGHELEKLTKAPPEGESLLQVQERMLDFLLDIDQQRKGKNILIVSHGNPIRMLHAGYQALVNKESLKWKSSVSPEPFYNLLN